MNHSNLVNFAREVSYSRAPGELAVHYLERATFTHSHDISISPRPVTGSLIFFPFSLSTFSSPLLCRWPPGPGQQGPEQGEDLSNLSDRASGPDGPEGAPLQEVHPGPAQAVRGGR